jgi:hypothetical protein
MTTGGRLLAGRMPRSFAAREARLWAAALSMASVLVVIGCGSNVPGTAVKAADQQNADGVTVAMLNPGSYPTKAVPLRLTPSATTGAILEGQRMATNVVVPSEIDATLLRLGVFNTGPVNDPQALRADIGRARADIAATHRFIAGFSTSRSTEGGSVPNTSVVNLVMRFAEPSTAAAAAEMAAAAPMWRPTPIPRYHEATASAFDMPQGVIVESFTPHGPYVLYQWVQTNKLAETAAELIAKTLDLQGPRIDQFVPTDPAQLAGLPVDPTALLTHTLPLPPDAATPAVGVYSAQAAMHFQTDPVKSAFLFTAAGVESMSLGLTMVYQAKDPTGAARVVDQLASDQAQGGATPTDGVSALPNAKCLDRGGDLQQTQFRFNCYAHAGRYAFNATSPQAQEARQQTAAQYLMLNGFR